MRFQDLCTIRETARSLAWPEQQLREWLRCHGFEDDPANDCFPEGLWPVLANEERERRKKHHPRGDPLRELEERINSNPSCNCKAFRRPDLSEQNPALELRFGGGYPILIASPELARAYLDVFTAARDGCSVMLQGETGVGKEMAARALHFASPRSQGPFVAVNCGAITESLRESELFGHRKGAFSGAVHHRGHIERADNGTLFLDEVGELSPNAQAMLLRVIQEKTFTPVGGESDKKVDVRFVFATNADLFGMVRYNKFRADLYWRILGRRITIPPLRASSDREVIPLARFLLEHRSSRLGTGSVGIHPDAASMLTEHGWPGNRRELYHWVEDLSSKIAENGATSMCLPEDIDFSASCATTGGGHSSPRRPGPKAKLTDSARARLFELAAQAKRATDRELADKLAIEGYPKVDTSTISRTLKRGQH
jgi:transcriptional regulator with GAF, ATPase, and Fis domain